MTTKTELEWAYAPVDFFEAPTVLQLTHGQLSVNAGKAVLTLASPTDPLPRGLQDSIRLTICRISFLSTGFLLRILSGWSDRLHFSLQPVGKSVSRLFQVEINLQPQPEPLRSTKVTGEPEGRIRTDGPLAEDDLVDSARRHADLARQAVLADSHGLQELF